MMRRLLAVTLLAPLALAADGSWSFAFVDVAEEVDAVLLRFEADAAAPPGPRDLALHVNRTGPDGATESWTTVAAVDLSPNAPFTARLPTRGPGAYLVDAEAAGAPRVEGLAFAPAEPAGNATLAAEVEDAPTVLEWTSDAVNAPGKTKMPGDALVARVRVADANGLDDVAALAFEYRRGGVLVHRDNLTGLDGGDANVTSRLVEHRFAASPLPAGDYVETVEARSRAGAHVRLDRAFRVADARPTLEAPRLAAAPVALDAPRALEATARLLDRNFGTTPLDPERSPGPGVLTARVLKGSATVAWPVSLGPGGGSRLDLTGVAPQDAPGYAVEAGAGVLAVPVRLDAPAFAPAGDYRVSVYWAPNASAAASLVGSLPFTVAELPRVALAIEPARARAGEAVLARLTLAGGAADRVEVVVAESREGVALATATVAPGETGVVRVPVPAALTPGRYAVRAAPAVAPDRAAFPPGSPGVASATLDVLPAAPPAPARVAVGPRAPAAEVPVDAALANASWTLTFPNGTSAPAGEHVAVADGRARVDGTGLAPGRHRLVGRAADGATAELRLDVGAWVAARLAAPRVPLARAPDGRLAGEVVITVDGNSPLRALLLAAPGWRGTAEIVDASGALVGRATLGEAPARVGDLALAPGATAVVRLALEPPAGADAGPVTVPLRVYAAGGRLA